MEVNYFGVLNMTRAFAPVLGANGGSYIGAMAAIDMHATDRENGVGARFWTR